MCRNIKTLFNLSPTANEIEIRASATQFVRKISGYAHPSKENEIAFEKAVNLKKSLKHPTSVLSHSVFGKFKLLFDDFYPSQI